MHSEPATPIAAPVFSSGLDLADWFEPLPGERMCIRIGSTTTGGRLTLLENRVAPGAAAPRHFHHAADELFIVLEGSFQVGSTLGEIDAGPGAAIFVPRGAEHDFVNVGSQEARLLSIFVPGGMESMFLEAARSRPEDLAAMAERHGTVVVAPVD